MRITEFASAADTMALWKMISDNTWAAIAQQAEAEQRAKAERAAARKSASKRGTGKSAAKPPLPKRLPPPLQHVSAPVAKDAKPLSSTDEKSAKAQQQQTVQPTAALPSANSVQPIQPTAAVPAIAKSAPVNTTVKTYLSQPPFQRNLSIASEKKSTGLENKNHL